MQLLYQKDAQYNLTALNMVKTGIIYHNYIIGFLTISDQSVCHIGANQSDRPTNKGRKQYHINIYTTVYAYCQL